MHHQCNVDNVIGEFSCETAVRKHPTADTIQGYKNKIAINPYEGTWVLYVLARIYIISTEVLHFKALLQLLITPALQIRPPA